MKEGTKVFLSVIILFLIIAWIFVIYSFIKNKDKVDENDKGIIAIAKRLGIDLEGDDNGDEDITSEGNEIIDSGGGGSSEGGGGDSGGGEPICENDLVSYALKNFISNSECLLNESTVCLSKRINCSVEVHNLDYQIEGDFEVKVSFFEEGIHFDEIILIENILPRQSSVFSETRLFEGDRANKDISCTFNTIKVPEKISC